MQKINNNKKSSEKKNNIFLDPDNRHTINSRKRREKRKQKGEKMIPSDKVKKIVQKKITKKINTSSILV